MTPVLVSCSVTLDQDRAMPKPIAYAENSTLLLRELERALGRIVSPEAAASELEHYGNPAPEFSNRGQAERDALRATALPSDE